MPRQPMPRPPRPQRPVMVVRPRKFLPPPGQFFATKRLKHNNDVYYKTLYPYNELLKAHETYLDSLFLTTAFKNYRFKFQPMSMSIIILSNYIYRKILVLKPYKIEFNQPLSVPAVPN